ncbi:MAG: hypothetical protein ACFB5Z_11875 [Elainellaceae cyanobacterium]
MTNNASVAAIAKSTFGEEVSPKPATSDAEVPGGGAGLTFGVMIATAFAVLLGRSLLRAKPKPTPVKRYRKQLPCTTCRFKGDNMHLRCAVHPYKAMTEEAMDCPDYWAKDSDRFEHSRH